MRRLAAYKYNLQMYAKAIEVFQKNIYGFHYKIIFHEKCINIGYRINSFRHRWALYTVNYYRLKSKEF